MPIVMRSPCGRRGGALGLTEDAFRLFIHFEEIELTGEVAEDGTVAILRCDGKVVQQ